MKEEFAKIMSFLHSKCTDEDEKTDLVKVLKKIEKEYALSEFKATRFFNEKTGLASYLEQVSSEYDKVISDLKAEKNHAQSISENLDATLRKLQSSIAYAKRIQNAILGDFTTQEDFLAESFVIYYPKDIVSGDFYWFGEEAGKKILCGVDCTGHGVSGAFMTLIANNHFNEVIRGYGITSPDDILAQTDILMYRSLHFAVNELIRDGMDAAIITIDEENQLFEFSGAHQDLLFFRNGELQIFEGSNFSIDGILKGRVPKVYRKEKISYQKGDCFYIFSDGFKDQFGGNPDPNIAKKYGSVRFKKLLTAVSHLPMSEQKEILEKEFRDWSAGNTQTDDVMVIGVRL